MFHACVQRFDGMDKKFLDRELNRALGFVGRALGFVGTELFFFAKHLFSK